MQSGRAEGEGPNESTFYKERLDGRMCEIEIMWGQNGLAWNQGNRDQGNVGIRVTQIRVTWESG